jgi:predicted DNA binding CopG/RHH family protein
MGLLLGAIWEMPDQAVKDAAAWQGVPYSRFVRSALEAVVHPKP